ncbi:hypothetical protein SLS64_010167 [Diaporthe eres]
MDESGYEDIKKYVPGGYHPVDIGDAIGQYTVLHKLGSGGFATVWLVQSSEDSRYYAVKILCADVSGAKANEREIMEYLGPHHHPNVVKLLRSFEITGPNGVHTYLTTSNVVFSLPDIQTMSPDEVCQLLGPIEREKLKLRDGSKSPHGPKRIVKNPDFSGFNIGMSSAAVMIIDFGEAFVLGEEVAKAASRVELSMGQQGFIVSLLQDMLVREPEDRLSARDASRRIESAASLFGGQVAEYLDLVEDIPDAPPPPPPPPEDSDSE